MALKQKENFERCPHPARYELIDKNGHAWIPTFATAQAAAEWAREHWPHDEQDPDRIGNGWDVQAVK